MTKYATVDPTTGTVVREFATMSDADADQALVRAADAYRLWREVDLADRATVLAKVADLHRQHATELAKLMTLEMGKPIAQAEAEVETCRPRSTTTTPPPARHCSPTRNSTSPAPGGR